MADPKRIAVEYVLLASSAPDLDTLGEIADQAARHLDEGEWLAVKEWIDRREVELKGGRET